MVRIRYGVEPATVRTLMARREFEMTSQWIPPEIKRALAEWREWAWWPSRAPPTSSCR